MVKPCIVNVMGMDDEHIKDQIQKGNWERCEGCGTVFIWNLLPDELVLTDKQAHPYGSTVAWETYVTGYTCPECGYKTIL
jgi:hypothetical protein